MQGDDIGVKSKSMCESLKKGASGDYLLLIYLKICDMLIPRTWHWKKQKKDLFSSSRSIFSDL